MCGDTGRDNRAIVRRRRMAGKFAGGLMSQSFDSVGARSGGVSAVAIESSSATITALRGAGIVLAGSALVAVAAHVSIPLWFTPVPITLQPFAVLLLGLLLGPRLAFATMVAYLA